ncbi:MAG: peptidyl-prolyl cis-trans isomerase [Roseivirga sp.]|uniref:peptidyl-prolyl cis-trans isomerase n=1 Tax=Roseivirga sp. TaxID=1964215 RepID=UPI001B0F3438|nr:peptidyl-prolyl cis-trans isomerase [Roseivirga sp.]MBO6660956.1 peptidyl-prolyl cis-trans isomerase [Roseivirga sp.]MBO6909060.1 peptidyl-prolyl cis-trans isomerase [Roseivirga sp.]
MSDSSQSTGNSETLVASVGNSYLFEADVANLIEPGMSAEDSASITTQYVRNWIKKELLVKEATSNVRIDQSEIERKVADYRYTLLSYEHQKLRIQQLLDTAVTEEEIFEYYSNNQDNFALRQNIFRGRFLKVNQQAPKKTDIRRWIKSSRPQDLNALKDYAFQFANNYSLEDSTWIKFDDITKNSPFSTITNKIQFLKTTRYTEETDSLYLYLLKIDDYKISEEISPLEFVREDIRNIILNKRKVELAKSLENEVFQNAKENEDYKIYR